MRSSELLGEQIRRLDGKDYGAYQSLQGEYRFANFTLHITQIPKDPYAPPHTGIYRVRVSHELLGVSTGMLAGRMAGIAYRDFLARRFDLTCRNICPGRRGTGYSGLISIDSPQQAILDRSAVVYTEDGIEVRFFVGLPANGRKINARVAELMLLQEVPSIIVQSFGELDSSAVRAHIHAAEDAEWLRTWIKDQGLVAFLADGALLPRSSGTSDEPLGEDEAILLRTPGSLRVCPELPHAGQVTGMGIPAGVTLIVGGGYHGKSTLLQTIQAGIYNHIPGDGRELCVTNDRAVKVRAHSGRFVSSVDISTFVDNLPLQKDTKRFSTPNASGSTSQAASIIEALEMEAQVLLMDEDTCAANLMIRDAKMQELVKKKYEPITVYIDRVRWLYERRGVSSILALGGAGDYFDVADTIIQMTGYQPHDVSKMAKAIARESMARRQPEGQEQPRQPAERFFRPSSLDARNEYGKRSVYATETNRIHFGRATIDLADVEQIVELSQTKGIAQAMLYCMGLTEGPISFRDVARRCTAIVEEKGLDGLCDKISGHLAQFRDFELASALNRFPLPAVTQG